MRFDDENLSDSELKNLDAFASQRLLGIFVQGFAKGPDGGRDAKSQFSALVSASKGTITRALARESFGRRAPEHRAPNSNQARPGQHAPGQANRAFRADCGHGASPWRR